MRYLLLLFLIFFTLVGCSTPLRTANSFEVTAQPYFTSKIENKQPVDNLSKIDLNQKELVIYCRWRDIEPGKHAHMFRLFDGTGNLVYVSNYEFEATESSWNTWSTYKINRNIDKPGTWALEVYIDGKKIAVNELTVLAAENQ